MKRTDIINSLITKHNYIHYLEIGVSTGENIRNVAINQQNIIGVDPDIKSAATNHITSDEFFTTNKKISKVNKKTGQNFYKNYTNFIEAKNNDRIKTKLKATFSTEFVDKLIDIYFPKNSIIYDPFAGISTTAVSCKKNGINYLGSEINEEFYKTGLDRLK